VVLVSVSEVTRIRPPCWREIAGNRIAGLRRAGLDAVAPEQQLRGQDESETRQES
jgi:hypothetical protein